MFPFDQLTSSRIPVVASAHGENAYRRVSQWRWRKSVLVLSFFVSFVLQD